MFDNKLLFHVFFFISEKAKRLKQAKEEAQAEIDKYKKEREGVFNEIQQKVRSLADKVAVFSLVYQSFW